MIDLLSIDDTLSPKYLNPWGIITEDHDTYFINKYNIFMNIT